MKKILLILLILIITGCSSFDNTKFKEEYESMNGKVTEYDPDTKFRTVNIKTDNPFIYKNCSDISKMMDNKESFIVYFGFNTCPWCRSIIESLIDCAKEEKIKTIYYVPVKDVRDVYEVTTDGNKILKKEAGEGYTELVDKLSNVLSDYKIGNTIIGKRIYAPNVIAVKNGEAVGIFSDSALQSDPNMELDENIIKDIKNHYKELFKKVK